MLVRNNFDIKTCIGKRFTFVNYVAYLKIRKYNKVLDLDGFFCDGILLLIFFRLFGIKVKKTCFDMTGVAPLVFDFVEKNNSRVGVIGGTKVENEKFLDNILQKWPNLNITFRRNGFFNEKEELSIYNEIISNNVEFLICGLGSPKQETFLTKLKKLDWKGTGFTCGAFISQTSNSLEYYPPFVNKYHLRFLYRLFKEPHTRRRTFVALPLFIICFFYDWLFQRWWVATKA